MIRLINDSGILESEIDSLDDVSFDQMIQAIHVIQDEMDITGTTAKEASTTIQGSISSMKAAWTNFLTGLADGNQDIDALTGDLVDSVATVADNILPRITATLPRLVSGVSSLIQKLIPKIPALIKQQLPVLIEGAAAIVVELARSLPAILAALWEVLTESISSLIGSLRASVPGEFQSIFNDAFEGIRYVYDTILKPCFDMIVAYVDNVLAPAFSWLAEFITENWGTIKDAFKGAIDIIGGIIDFFTALFKGDWEGMFQAVKGILSGALEYITGVFSLWQALFENIGSILLDLITSAFEAIKTAIMEKITDALNFLIEKFNSLPEPIQNVVSVVLGIIYVTVSTIRQKLMEMRDSVSGVFEQIKNTVSEKLNAAKTAASAALTSMHTIFTSGVTAIKTTVSDVFEQITGAMREKMETAKNVVSDAIEKIKSFFNFEWSLPSLKLPHFSISGSFSLNPPSVPSFGVDWYKRAMDDPVLMTQPTAFGINANGQIMAGGEAGSEVVSGTDTLMSMISSAVSAQNGAMVDVLYKILEAILSLDEGMGGNLREALAGVAFSINNREFARLVKAV